MMKGIETILFTKIVMRILNSALKTTTVLGLFLLTTGQGATPAFAQQQDEIIPLLPGIEEPAPQIEAPMLDETMNAPDSLLGAGMDLPPPVEQAPIVVDQNAEAQMVKPPEAALEAAKPVAAQVTNTNTAPNDPTFSALQDTKEDDNLFYDADALVPKGEFVKKGGTIKANPRTQPASKFIVVKKNSSANSLKAKLVSASRAMKLGRYDSSLAMYDALYKYNKRDPQILMGRALSLQHLGRIDEALVAYNEFLDRKPKDVNARVNMLGLMVTKYPAVALRHLMDLHEQHEGNVGIIAQIALTYAQLGQPENALKYFGIAAGMEPDNASHLFNMGIVTDKAGDQVSAIDLYERALELDAMNGANSVPRNVIYERLAQLR